jgi:hypothetical protein
MTNESFRRELGHVFDEMAGSPSSALPDRVRSSLTTLPEQRGPYWIAGVAAVVIAAVVIGVLFVGNPLNHQPSKTVPVAGASPTPSASLSPSPSPSPSPLPTPSSNLPAFTCSASAQHFDVAQVPPLALVDAVRPGTHAGYDRLTIEFMTGHPTDVNVSQQGDAAFTQGASGQRITLSGSFGILVTIQGTDEHTDYSGPIDFKTGYPVLLEARQVQDFEGTVQWGLGLSKSACYRAFFLTNPTRLVIDIQTP